MTELTTLLDRAEHLPRDIAREGGLMGLAERGWLPDAAVRLGIRRLLAQRLAELEREPPDEAALRERLSKGPVAVKTTHANRQHYEVPAAFYKRCLGYRLKYSGCYWPQGVRSLNQAEDAALKLVVQRAQIVDGMDILELGCGWGSLTLWLAENFRNARVTAVSNSASQRAYILDRAGRLGLGNVSVMTADMNDFDTGHRYDRVVSVEMFEHMANHAELLRRVAGWLKDEGKLFVHVFSHWRDTYLFEEDGQSNWMGRHFFTGGMMPSHKYLPGFDGPLRCEQDWWQDGTHYQQTAEAWLSNADRARREILPLFEQAYGKAGAKLWLRRWRIFFMACAELWGYHGGTQWGVSHYRFVKRSYEGV